MEIEMVWVLELELELGQKMAVPAPYQSRQSAIGSGLRCRQHCRLNQMPVGLCLVLVMVQALEVESHYSHFDLGFVLQKD